MCVILGLIFTCFLFDALHVALISCFSHNRKKWNSSRQSSVINHDTQIWEISPNTAWCRAGICALMISRSCHESLNIRWQHWKHFWQLSENTQLKKGLFLRGCAHTTAGDQQHLPHTALQHVQEVAKKAAFSRRHNTKLEETKKRTNKMRWCKERQQIYSWRQNY